MRQFSANVTALLSRDAIETFMLVRYGNDRFTSLPYNVTINMEGLDTVFSTMGDNTGGLLSVDAPDMSSSVDKSSYKIVLSDPSFVFRDLALNGNVGARVEVYLGLINTTGSSIGAAGPGMPLLSHSDLIMVYAGYADGQHYSVDFDGSAQFIIEGSSPFGDLDATKAFYTSKEYAEIRTARSSNPGSPDTAYYLIF